MGTFNSDCVTFLSISLFFFACIRTTSPDADPSLNICADKNCGQGKCIASGNSPIGFECECNPGWTKIELGFVIIPFCNVPNCTLNLNCGSPTPTPPPGLVLPPPQLNFSSACALVWCGEGTCEAIGGAYTCQCNEDASNLINMPVLPCFKECFLGADCKNLGLGPLANPALQPPQPTPPTPLASAATGPSGASNWIKNMGTFVMVVMLTTRMLARLL